MLNKESDLQHFYQITKCHVSELTFFDEEIKFFKHVLEKFRHDPLHEGHPTNKVQLIFDRFVLLKFIRNNVIKDVLEHQGNIESIIKESNVRSLDFVKMENDRIENEIKDLHKVFKDIKKEVFSIFKGLYQH